jgi:hypothetical protein
LAEKQYKIKRLEDNDELLFIGPLFRTSHSADWRIQVRFKKSPKKSVLASLIPDLAVGRLYNATHMEPNSHESLSFDWKGIVGNSSGEYLQLPQVDKLKRNERYFIVEDDDGYLAIPQLELARVLFIQNSKMFHYALEPVALGIDFHSFKPDHKNLLIHVTPSAQLTKSQFERVYNPNKLAYTLADKNGVDAFLSISKNFCQYRLDKKESNKETFTTWWTFGFEPPTLNGCSLTVTLQSCTGQYKNSDVRVVQEILGISNVPHSLPENIHFFSQDWLKASVKQQPSDNDKDAVGVEHYEIDDEQSASSFLPEKIVQAKGNMEFSLQPKRSAATLSRNGKIRLLSQDTEREVSGREIATTDLPSILGTLTPVVTSSNSSEPADISVFEGFKMMFEQVLEIMQFQHAGYEIKTLHKVGNSKLHRKKTDNSLRQAAIAHLRNPTTLESFTLIEIDRSDDPNKSLSTLIFKYGCLDEARSRVDAILSAQVAKSLSWPRDYLQANDIKSEFVNHPTGFDPNTSSTDAKLVKRWARNTIDALQRI